MRTATIEIVSYKDNNLQGVLHELFPKESFSPEEEEHHCAEIEDLCSTVFEYGEFLNATIIIDEDFNIVGGKIHPFKERD